MKRRSLSAHVGALAFAFALATPARAQEAPPDPSRLPTREAALSLSEQRVVLSTSYRDLFDAEIQRKLVGGLPTLVVLRVLVFRETENKPVALSARSCKVTYDLWDEIFRLQVTYASAVTSSLAINLEGVLRQCGEAKNFFVTDAAALTPNENYSAAVFVEINPVSPEMLERIRRWVMRPSGGTAIGPADSILGSFVGLFVPRVQDADRKLAFRTASFRLPAR